MSLCTLHSEEYLLAFHAFYWDWHESWYSVHQIFNQGWMHYCQHFKKCGTSTQCFRQVLIFHVYLEVYVCRYALQSHVARINFKTGNISLSLKCLIPYTRRMLWIWSKAKQIFARPLTGIFQLLGLNENAQYSIPYHICLISWYTSMSTTHSSYAHEKLTFNLRGFLMMLHAVTWLKYLGYQYLTKSGYIFPCYQKSSCKK